MPKFDFFIKVIIFYRKEICMQNKISSEIKMSYADFNLKVGTTDKKNPETVYATFGVYISPNGSKESYSEDMDELKQAVELYSKQQIKSMDNFCKKESILVTDIADTRMSKGKKSFLEIQYYVKPSTTVMNNSNKKFKEVSKVMAEEIFTPFSGFVMNELHALNYSTFKSKK